LKHYKDMYEVAYEILGDLTPLTTDCGKLCDAACCKGDSTTGMRLFPNEETTLPVINGDGVRLCVCDGSCDRNTRPLSCRIFPLFPVVLENGRISAEIDTRALRLCPLAENAERVKFDKDFISAVRRVGRLLYRDEECREFINEASAEIRQYGKLYGKVQTLSKRRF